MVPGSNPRIFIAPMSVNNISSSLPRYLDGVNCSIMAISVLGLCHARCAAYDDDAIEHQLSEIN